MKHNTDSETKEELIERIKKTRIERDKLKCEPFGNGKSFIQIIHLNGLVENLEKKLWNRYHQRYLDKK